MPGRVEDLGKRATAGSESGAAPHSGDKFTSAEAPLGSGEGAEHRKEPLAASERASE